MTPRQRFGLLIVGCFLLLAVGAAFFSMLIKGNKPDTTDLATNIQGNDLLQQTGSTNTGSNNSGSTISIQDITTPETQPSSDDPLPLTILLPPWADQQVMKELFQRVDSDHQFTSSFFQPNTLATYLKAIEAFRAGSRQVDIMLVPWSEVSGLTDWGAQVDRSTTQPPIGQFHPQVGQLMNSSSLLFVPYALDPWVTITKAPIKNTTLGTFLQQYSSPLEVGTSSPDPATTLLFSLILDQLVAANNISLIPKLFLPQTEKNCSTVLLCLQHKPALRIMLSQLHADERNQVGISTFPSRDGKVPTTVRGRVIRGNDSKQAITHRLIWIQNYLEKMDQDSLPHETLLLPAYHERFQRLLYQDEWAWFSSVAYKLTIITDSFSRVQEFFSSLPLIHLVDGSYRPEIYLEKWREIRTP